MFAFRFCIERLLLCAAADACDRGELAGFDDGNAFIDLQCEVRAAFVPGKLVGGRRSGR